MLAVAFSVEDGQRGAEQDDDRRAADVDRDPATEAVSRSAVEDPEQDDEPKQAQWPQDRQRHDQQVEEVADEIATAMLGHDKAGDVVGEEDDPDAVVDDVTELSPTVRQGPSRIGHAYATRKPTAAIASGHSTLLHRSTRVITIEDLGPIS